MSFTPLIPYVSALTLLTLTSSLSCADEAGVTATFPYFDEIRFGVLAADLEPGGASDDEIAINFELLTPHIGKQYDHPVLDVIFNPRLHFGATLATGDGLNQGYAGLTWDYHLTDALFVEASFGGAAHDGETDDDNPDSYGCTVQFRESLSVGVNVTDQFSVMATVDHMSNAGLCDENQGLTNAGVRLGYRW
jgi:hypothetical protein